jgi:uncharacterized membrane protein (DUF485 family)
MSSSLTAAGFGPILSVSATLNLVPTNNANTGANDQKNMIIGVIVGVTVLLCVIVIGTIVYMRRRAKIFELRNPS